MQKDAYAVLCRGDAAMCLEAQHGLQMLDISSGVKPFGVEVGPDNHILLEQASARCGATQLKLNG